MQIFLSPDCDDEGLFGSYILQRTKAEVYIVCDGVIHEERFGVERGIEARRQESREACKILGVQVSFLGLSDKELKLSSIVGKLDGIEAERVFAPAYQGGNKNHDIISMAAHILWGNRVLYYSTYGEDLTLHGQMPIYPTPQEAELKEKVLACYKTQHSINAPHFEAVKGKPEYLNLSQTI